MEVFTAATLAALVWKVTSVLKYASVGQWREVVTQIVPWAGGFLAVLLAAQADVSENLTVWGTMVLGNLDIWSLLLAGISIGSTASVAYDFKKARDNTDSSVEPPLSKPVAS